MCSRNTTKAATPLSFCRGSLTPCSSYSSRTRRRGLSSARPSMADVSIVAFHKCPQCVYAIVRILCLLFQCAQTHDEIRTFSMRETLTFSGSGWIKSELILNEGTLSFYASGWIASWGEGSHHQAKLDNLRSWRNQGFCSLSLVRHMCSGSKSSSIWLIFFHLWIKMRAIYE